MDPNETLNRLLVWARQSSSDKQRNEAHLAATDILNLHQWLSNGGFSPDDWDINTIMARKADKAMRGHP